MQDEVILSTNMKGLKKQPIDVDYLDPKTFKKICSRNECANNFTIWKHKLWCIFPKWLGKWVFFRKHTRVCNKCGREESGKEETQRSQASYMHYADAPMAFHGSEKFRKYVMEEIESMGGIEVSQDQKQTHPNKQ